MSKRSCTTNKFFNTHFVFDIKEKKSMKFKYVEAVNIDQHIASSLLQQSYEGRGKLRHWPIVSLRRRVKFHVELANSG